MNLADLHRDDAVASADPQRAVGGFRARWPWRGGDLQTLRNLVVRPGPSFRDAPAMPVRFPMDDGTADILSGMLHRPARDSGRPLAVLIHGLTGSAESAYVRVTARHLLDRGYPVLRLDLRGAGASAGHCREQYHAGRSEDLRAVVDRLDPALCRHGIVAVGYSLGGNMLLKLLGEDGAGAGFRAAAAVSPPVDLAGAASCILRRRNWIYHRHLLAGLKAEVRATRGGLSAPLARAAEASRRIVDFDDRVVAPRYGFAGAADYYARASSQALVAGIRTPTLVIHARDDPWIPAAPFEDRRWRDNAALRLILASSGGHVGFHGSGSAVPWHDRLIAAFFAEIGGETGFPKS